MRIQHNIMAMSAYRNYTNNVSAMKKNLEKLSSGYKINRAGDDAAGLAISEKMRAQITGLETAQKNAKDGISLVQTAEGALTEVHDMLNRMVELATQSANGTYDNATDRNQMQKELEQLRSEINRIADSSNFNGIKLLDGSMSKNVESAPFEVTTQLGAADVVYDADYASGVFGSVAAPPATPPAGPTGDTVLHGEGHAGVKGSFTIAFDQVYIAAPSAAGTAAIEISIGGQKFTVKASAAGQGMNGNQIAARLVAGSGAYLVVGSNGAISFAASTGAVSGNNALVYKATNNNNGTVTYELSGYTSGAGAYASVAASGAWENLDPATATALKAAAGTSLDLTVGVNAKTGGGTLTDNRTNYGTIDVTQTLVNEPAPFGTAKMDFTMPTASTAASMKITLGAGKDTVDVEFQLAANAVGLGKNAINLSGMSEAEQKRAIANALQAAAAKASLGINVGINGSGAITLSEITSGSGASLAKTSIQDAMRDEETFGDLLKVKLGKAQDVVNVSTLTVDDSKIYEGNTAEITVGNDTTKYVFTSDEAKLAATGSAVPAGTKYVSLEGDVVQNLANAIGQGAKVDGNKITITTNGPASAAVTFGSTVGWTGNSGLKLQIGDTADGFNQLHVNINDCHTDAMGLVGVDGTLTSIADISIEDQESAGKAVDVIKAAVNYVSDVRGTLGATQNRLDHTINNLSVMTENIQDAESTIRDVDVAEEMMAYTKNNILIQSAQAMLAQANQVPQGVLQLLQ